MVKIEFYVNNNPLNLEKEECNTLFNDGDVGRVWDLFYSQAQKIYAHNESEIKRVSSELSKDGVYRKPLAVSSLLLEDLRASVNRGNGLIEINRSQDAEIKYDDSQNSYSVRMIEISAESQKIVLQIIKELFSKDFIAYMENYFNSYFTIDYVSYSRTYPDIDPIVSFRWHRDAGPKCQTHIMIYMDSTEETDSRTEFINYTDSDIVQNSNYEGIMSIDKRISNIHDICPDVNIISPILEKGDALIFNATRVFHKGIHPKKI